MKDIPTLNRHRPNLKNGSLLTDLTLIDLKETPSYFLLKIDVNSVIASEISIELTHRTLVLRENSLASPSAKKRVSIQVDSDRTPLNATYRNGVLWIRILKQSSIQFQSLTGD